jgi:hypothetical protein
VARVRSPDEHVVFFSKRPRPRSAGGGGPQFEIPELCREDWPCWKLALSRDRFGATYTEIAYGWSYDDMVAALDLLTALEAAESLARETRS